MSDKSLRFMDKTQLLNIMRQQEIEIERLGAENEKLNAGKEEQMEKLTSSADRQLAEKGEQIVKLQAELSRLSAENVELAAKAPMETGEAERIELIAKVEKIELAAQKKIDEAENLISEKDGQIAAQSSEITWLQSDKEKQAGQIESLRAKIDEQNRQIERLLAEIEMQEAPSERPEPETPQAPLQFFGENPGSLAEASISVAGVMQAAQEAADLYLQNIRQLEAESAAAAEKIEEEAEKKAKAIIEAAEQRCKELENAAKKSVSEIQGVSSLYMEFIDKSHAALHDMADRYKLAGAGAESGAE